MYRRILFSLLVFGCMASLATAQNVHLKGGAKAEPSFFDLGLSLQSAGELAGLGNGDVLVTVLATANPTADCVNPGTGEHRPPGQNPAEVEVTGSQSIPESEIKNGNTPFLTTTVAPTSPIPGAPDCPNPNWTENITDLAFTSATITVEQPPGTIVLVVSCTIDPPSEDGAIDAGDVTCE